MYEIRNTIIVIVIFLPATSEKKDDCVIKFDVPNPHTNKFA